MQPLQPQAKTWCIQMTFNDWMHGDHPRQSSSCSGWLYDWTRIMRRMPRLQLVRRTVSIFLSNCLLHVRYTATATHARVGLPCTASISMPIFSADKLGLAQIWCFEFGYSCSYCGSFHFLADRTNGRAYATVLRLSVCPSVCPSSVTLCIVAKRCVVEQKLLLRAYRKSYMEIDWYQNEWPWP